MLPKMHPTSYIYIHTRYETRLVACDTYNKNYQRNRPCLNRCCCVPVSSIGPNKRQVGYSIWFLTLPPSRRFHLIYLTSPGRQTILDVDCEIRGRFDPSDFPPHKRLLYITVVIVEQTKSYVSGLTGTEREDATKAAP